MTYVPDRIPDGVEPKFCRVRWGRHVCARLLPGHTSHVCRCGDSIGSGVGE